MDPVLNTLFVTQQGAYLRKDHGRVVVELPEDQKAEFPLLHIGSFVLFGRVMVSPALVRWCGENGRPISFLGRGGRFYSRLRPPCSGNVLLRLDQFRAADDEQAALPIARNIVAGKIQNSRNSIMRSRRDSDCPADREALGRAAEQLADSLMGLPARDSLDQVRGVEGEAARAYFGVLDRMLLADREHFSFERRTRRPPRDPVNSVLSFLYAVLLHDCAAAAEAVGLDPQVGFLHAPRPGRPSLALDLMEELRPVLADRLALTLFNRRQLTPDDFHWREGGAVHIQDDARKEIIKAYQTRKGAEVTHPVLERRVPLGLVPHLQARLLARTLRGDLDAYPAFIHD